MKKQSLFLSYTIMKLKISHIAYSILIQSNMKLPNIVEKS